MPTSQPLLIIVNGNVVTKRVPSISISIVRERGKRVSTADFIIQNGGSLGLSQWNSVVIYSSDLSTVYFNGFLMSYKASKNGIRLDYDCKCSSVEILLQRAVINGSFTGTDAEILIEILANAYPDLSDFFDWSSGITAALTSDISLDFQDMNLLDALDMLSAQAGGVDYAQGYDNGLRVNMIKNPALTFSTAHYGGTLVTDSYFHGLYGDDWNENNVEWGAGYGENGGGIRITSQLIGGSHCAFMRIGRASQSNDLPFAIEFSEYWFAMRARMKFSAYGGTVRIRMVTYNSDGTMYHDGENIGPTYQIGTSWSEWERSFDLGGVGTLPFETGYGVDEIPSGGWCEFELAVVQANGPFTLDIDEFYMEIRPYNQPFEPDAYSYFDGESEGARWLGAANDSASAVDANPLTWGSNPDAAFDLDIDSGSEIFDDFTVDFNGFDSLHSIIVTGGWEFEDVDWIYPNNGNVVSYHFDLELAVHPAENQTQPIIYANIGNDDSPNWSTQTVTTRQDGFDVGDVLYDLEDHWVEFQDAPPDLELSWRITGRIKKRIRIVVTNEELKDESGIELTGTIHIEGNTTPAQAYDLGQAELNRRNAAATYGFTTYEPGLKPNDEIDITDSLHGISDDTVIIERVTHTYLGGGKGRYAIECGRYNSDLSDILMETHNLAEPKIPIGQDTTEVTVALLVDQDGAVLLDQDSNQLLDIS